LGTSNKINPSFIKPLPFDLQQSSNSLKRKKILCWSDSCTCTTGFGNVSRHIYKALYDTGLYEINQLAINFFGEFYDKEAYPYVIIPAKLNDPKDPYGCKMLLSSLKNQDFDYLFVINDVYVTQAVAAKVEEIRQEKIFKGKTPFKIVYYYPIDCQLRPGYGSFIEIADVAVAYTEFAKEETLKTYPGLDTPVIYHGTDTETFKPLSQEENNHWRKKYLKVHDPETFVVLTANRNSRRKDIAKTLIAFKEFKHLVPNSILYAHTQITDQGPSGESIDLGVVCEQLKLIPQVDVKFPANYSAAQGFEEKVLNRLYNIGNMYLTTTLGEGFGCITTECMAAGTPVVGGKHTSHPEIIGTNNERGYLYTCRDLTYVDNTGLRPLGYTEDIVETMLKCYNGHFNRTVIPKIRAARLWTEKYSWANIGKQWVALFKELDEKEYIPKTLPGMGEEV